jgi:hypothetical protein
MYKALIRESISPTDPRLASRATRAGVLHVGTQWRVVQSAERRTLDPEVGGSTPPPPAVCVRNILVSIRSSR